MLQSQIKAAVLIHQQQGLSQYGFAQQYCTARYRIMLTFPFYSLKDRIILKKVIYFYARQFSWLKGECYDSVDKSAKIQSIPNGEKSSGFRQVNDIAWAAQTAC